MKKFLTVLLALSVVFTYTVGTAFALPSDGTQTAGLTQAKAEAVAELDDFDYSVYTDAGQTIVKGYIAEAKTDIEKATSSTDVSNAMTNFEKKVDNIASYLKDVVADAVREAKTQVKDYLYLFGLDYDELLKCSTTISPAAIAKGNIKLDSLALDDEEAFITDFKKAVARYTAAASVADVQEQMNDALRVIDKYMACLLYTSMPQLWRFL